MITLPPFHWSRLSLRERLLFVTTLGAAFYALIFMLLLPRVAERKRLVLQKKSLQEEVSTLSSTLPALMREAQESKKEAERTDPTPSTEPDPPFTDAPLSMILEELGRQARLRKVRLIELHPAPAEKVESHEVLPLTITTRSRFFNLGNYLLALERLPGPIAVERLKIESTPETSPEVVAEMSLRIYRKGGP
ncbi:MAG: hypothetical protein WAO55_06550 [Candidatus Manganitrophaceae bacterium]